MLEYWNVFLVLGIVLFFAIMFFTAFLPSLSDMKFRFRFIYNIGYSFLWVSFMLLIWGSIAEVFF